MWEKIFRRLREKSDRPLKETMLIIFLCGILLFVIFLPTEKSGGGYIQNGGAAKKQKTQENTEKTESADSCDIDEYKDRLENELEDFLTSVSGVGDVKVLIYMKNSKEYIVEKNNPTTSSKNGESSDASRDETTVYTVNDNGKEVPFISQTKCPAIDGVVVAAKGASNENVRLQIVRLVMALYGVEANKVEVLVMK